MQPAIHIILRDALYTASATCDRALEQIAERRSGPGGEFPLPPEVVARGLAAWRAEADELRARRDAAQEVARQAFLAAWQAEQVTGACS